MGEAMDISRQLMLWIERMQAIARTGLAWESDVFDRERYEELLRLSAEMAACLNPQLTLDKDLADRLYRYWLSQVELGEEGYVTPKVSAAAAVFDSQDQILLVQRAQDSWWDFPAGWCDIGFTAAETAAKEVREETGLSVTPTHLIGVYDSCRWDFRSPPHSFNLLFYCRLDGGTLKLHSTEISEAGFFSEDALPEILPGARPGLEHAFAFHRGEVREAYFDL